MLLELPQTPRTPGIDRAEVLAPAPPELITGVPAFLGFARQGPIHQPQRITLWSQFLEIFGEPLEAKYLASAVRGFFENDGEICFVVRLDETLPLDLALGQGDDQTGALGTLEDLTPLDLVCAPDLVSDRPSLAALISRQRAILRHCEQQGDRFAILDAPLYPAPPWTGLVDVEQSLAQLLTQRTALESKQGALYYPWVKVDQGPSPTLGFVPPCGHIAGVYARSDRQFGIHKAPANEALKGVLKLQVDLQNRQQDRLNPAGINCLRSFPGRGLRIWGARTLSHEAHWQYVNIRRLFLTIGRWLEQQLQAVMFEPNDLRLWVRIERELTAYFEDLLQQGALRGLTPQTAFYVKCDAETNLPNAREAGQVVTDIGIAPVVPSEFIQVRLILGTSGITLIE